MDSLFKGGPIRSLYTTKLPPNKNNSQLIGPLQLAIHVVQTPMLENKSLSGTRQIKTYIILNGNFLSLSCPSATFALQFGRFIPREWLAAKGL